MNPMHTQEKRVDQEWRKKEKNSEMKHKIA